MPLKFLYDHLYDTKWAADISGKLKREGVFHARIASNGDWKRSLYIAYHLKSRYYGRAKDNVTEDELESDLAKFDIEYYIEWGNKDAFSFLAKYEEINKGEIPDLRVYRIKAGQSVNVLTK